MNPRILELVTLPQNIKIEDLEVLKNEIQNKPYMQSIRALYLYGIHKYQPENYKTELTTTAAYTTDKKILYQFINGEIQDVRPEVITQKKEEEKVVEKVDNDVVPNEKIVEEVTSTEEIVQEKPIVSIGYNKQPFPLPKTENKPVFIEGKQNRILFEGEENFLDEENSQIVDVESSLESGNLVVTNKAVIDDSKLDDKTAESSASNNQNFETEKVEVENFAKEDVISENKEKVADLEIENVENKNEEEITNDEKPVFLTPKIQEPTPEVVINEEKIETKKIEDVVENSSELSFQGLDSFMPNVEIPSAKKETVTPKTSIPVVNKHEEEMKRLIEEVERKVKEKKQLNADKKKVEAEKEVVENAHGEINFSQTQDFIVDKKENDAQPEATKENLNDNTPQKAEAVEEKDEAEELQKSEEIKTELNSTWKPMTLDAQKPDSTISKAIKIDGKPQEEKISEIIEERPVESILIQEEVDDSVEALDLNNKKEEAVQQSKEELPVMNLSFFSSDISQLSVEEKAGKNIEIEDKKPTIEDSNKLNENVEIESSEAQKSANTEDSNIPTFINTWQSWLKIDRTEEIEKQKVESKNKAIEAFIENNPKISQLKDEVQFVAKEKTDDISHLMTETLANLYVEQKLYSKSIKAFQILAEKFPEKKSYFEGKIEEIKESRNKN